MGTCAPAARTCRRLRRLNMNIERFIMSKFFRHSTVTVCTYHDDGSPVSGPAVEEYSVRSLGRGRWYVEREDGYHWVARTAELQRFFRPHVYEDGYYSSGESVYAYEEVQVKRDSWWRW